MSNEGARLKVGEATVDPLGLGVKVGVGVGVEVGVGVADALPGTGASPLTTTAGAD
jgi:hypothetical protein